MCNALNHMKMQTALDYCPLRRGGYAGPDREAHRRRLPEDTRLARETLPWGKCNLSGLPQPQLDYRGISRAANYLGRWPCLTARWNWLSPIHAYFESMRS